MLEIILNKIKEYDSICIFGHVFPDGDCYGSQIGLKEAILNNFPNKKVYAVGSGFKKMLDAISPMDKVDDEVITNSLGIVLDCSTLDRVEDKRINLVKEMIMIDHHVKTKSFTSIEYVDESAISTTEILCNIFRKWNFKLNEKASNALLLGLITDGGRYLYSPSKNEFDCTSYLLDFGGDLDKIYSSLYLLKEDELKLKGFVYSHYKKAHGVLYIVFNEDELKKLQVNANVSSLVVNLLSNVEGYPFWCAFSPFEDGTYKAEFRCKKGYLVSDLAIKLGGGGHPCASGCTLKSKDEIEKVIKMLEDLAYPKYEDELKAMIESAVIAREKILEIYNTNFDVEIKEDNSPVTLADKSADKIISTYLKEKFPSYSFLTEESIDDKTRLKNRYVFIVDPVDGTKDFVDKNGEFTTNIALCKDHEIVVGVVSIPTSKEIYYAVKGHGSYYMKDENSKPIKIHVSDKLDDLTMYISRFHATDFEYQQSKSFPQIKRVEAHGSSLKACMIARGLGEIHYRFSAGTKEWDTAAIQIIVKEAGGIFIKPDGKEYKYNREDVYNREGYIIVNRKENILIKE